MSGIANRRIARQPAVARLAGDVLTTQLAEARGHVAGAMDGADPEELHDLRVAVRRMRAAIRLFERALPAADAVLDPARSGLKATGSLLGRARDLDVQVQRLQEWLESSGRGRDAAGLRALNLLAKERTAARSAMRRHLRGAVFARRMESVAAAAEAARRARARRTAPRLLRRPSKQVLLSVALARERPDDPSVFHALRIDVKRLRYALEFLEPALAFSTRKLVRRLRNAQDALGALQDAAIEQDVAGALAERAGDDGAVRSILELYRHSKADAQAGHLDHCRGLLDDLEDGVRRLREHL